jgi:hypothetical protein
VNPERSRRGEPAAEILSEERSDESKELLVFTTEAQKN